MSRRPNLRCAPLPPPSSPLLKALTGFSHARAEAQRVLARSRCGCCVSARVHLARHVGIAGGIVVHGRAREDLFSRI